MNSTSRKRAVANVIEEIAVEIGTVRISCLNTKNKESYGKIEDVLFVPTLERSLLSVGQLIRKDLQVIFNKEGCTILKENIEVADLRGGLYLLRQKEKAYSSLHFSGKCIYYWHKAIGHRDPETIKIMVKEDLAKGIKIGDCCVKKTCQVCLQGKFSRLPFQQSTTHTNFPLGIIHLDIYGPMKMTTPGGNRYFVTFIDDKSRYITVYLLKQKAEVLEKFKEFNEIVKTKFNRKPKLFRSDQGGEYTSNEFKRYTYDNKVSNFSRVVHILLSNGISERKNRSLMEMARCSR